ncbi:MAG: hypothetical protein RMJ28_03540 [Nitrososphaerota archaeon]|nr:hypothetical protein [Candidatus Calditenuaceae archaeon]MDW8073294.1 hypothetical protein [Nitrososphaerota archaeon]
MKLSAVFSALLGLGLLVQIILGELGLTTRALRDIHATIGLAGLVLTAVALRLSSRSRLSLAYLAALLAMVAVQAALGLILYGIIFVDVGLFLLVEEVHRYNAYLMLAVGLIGGVAVAVTRRRSAQTVAESR